MFKIFKIYFINFRNRYSKFYSLLINNQRILHHFFLKFFITFIYILYINYIVYVTGFNLDGLGFFCVIRIEKISNNFYYDLKMVICLIYIKLNVIRLILTGAIFSLKVAYDEFLECFSSRINCNLIYFNGRYFIVN